MIFDFCLLEDISDEIDIWGGKAYSLMKLINNSFIVPKGFVIPSYFFDLFRNNDLDFSLFENKLVTFCEKLFELEDCDLIFRSSANVEGRVDKAYCGVFDSFVYNKENKMIKSVEQVWKSAYSPYVNMYNDFYNEKIRMAVIVQEIIVGDYSAVVQSYDIIENKNRIILEYSNLGLDAVVKGYDSYRVYIDYESKNCKYVDNSPELKDEIIEGLIYDCKKAEEIFCSHVEMEIQIKYKTIFYLQVRSILCEE
jgi:phosphoenolpyruvate synthase/pyruvate phosphate dikinase